MKYINNITNGIITLNDEIITEYAILKIEEDTALIKTHDGHITSIPVTTIPEEIPTDILEQSKKTTTNTKKKTNKKTTTKKQETKKEE